MRSRILTSGLRPAWMRYGVAVCVMAVAVLIRRLLDPALGNYLPFFTDNAGVALVVWLCRWRPAALAAIAGFLASDYLFVPPRNAFVVNPATIVAAIGYFLSSGVIVFVGALMHRARDRAEHDSVERKRGEEALRESERRVRERAVELATFLEAAPTPVLIVHDPEGRHITGNQAAEHLLRISGGAEISLGAPAERRPSHFRPMKDGRELRLDELPAQRAARGEPVRDFEFSIVFDDGTVRDLLGYGTPLLNEQGQPRGAVHVLVDITDRRRAEEQLRSNAERYRLLVSVIADVPWTANGQGIFVEPQPAWEKFTGQKWEEYRGLSWFNALHSEDRLVAEETWRRACADGSNYESQGRLWHAPTQQYRHVLARAVPLHNTDGTVREWVGACLDVHEKKTAVDALLLAQRKLVRYVAEVERKAIET